MSTDRGGSRNPRSMATTLIDLLNDRARQYPERTCYTFLGIDGKSRGNITYRGLHHNALAIARRLTERGFNGERALLLYPSGLEFISAFFGCLYAGVIAVPAPVPRAGRENKGLKEMARDSQAAVVITTAALVAKKELICAGAPELERLEWI